jgi:alginate O-acetyltransferase complex protein AlgI
VNFATAAYGIFLAVAVLVHWLLPRSLRRPWLIIASLLFYGTWNPLYVPGFVALTVANWGFGMVAARRRRLGIGLALLVDLGLLAYFKYAAWLVGSSWGLLGPILGQPAAPVLDIVLPLAISFVTFTLLAYVIDVGRGTQRPEPSLARFALFISFFPHLIAGPIMRGYEFLPQVRHPRPFILQHLAAGVPLLVAGLLKKTVGDNLAPTVERVFSEPERFSSGAIWIGIIAFAFQIYFDFSGYTDMALGSAALLGYRLPQNFRWPYRATSVQEFWRRWHMTLSRWLRDYLYFPLGGSRHGEGRTYAALMVTWLLGGLWHGAGLTFVVWGAWLGSGLCLHRWYRLHLAERLPIPAIAGWALTFAFTLIGWVFFRSLTMADAGQVLARAFAFQPGEGVPVAVVVACAILVVAQLPALEGLALRAAPAGSYRRWAALGATLAVAVVLLPVTTTDFIYFQF